MKHRLLSILLVMIFGCLVVSAKKVTGFSSKKTSQTGYITIIVDAVDYRPDLTRVYARLKGKPHTSERIDNLLLITPQGKSFAFTDIDGVDMKRWFQWEDDGSIDVEIDFPTMKEQRQFTLKSSGPKGESVTTVAKTKK